MQVSSHILSTVQDLCVGRLSLIYPLFTPFCSARNYEWKLLGGREQVEGQGQEQVEGQGREQVEGQGREQVEGQGQVQGLYNSLFCSSRV